MMPQERCLRRICWKIRNWGGGDIWVIQSDQYSTRDILGAKSNGVERWIWMREIAATKLLKGLVQYIYECLPSFHKRSCEKRYSSAFSCDFMSQNAISEPHSYLPLIVSLFLFLADHSTSIQPNSHLPSLCHQPSSVVDNTPLNPSTSNANNVYSEPMTDRLCTRRIITD